MSCKCSTQTFETIQVISPPNFIVYCSKCKTPKKKKIDYKKREIDQQKIKTAADTNNSIIQKEIDTLKKNYNAKKKDNNSIIKTRETLVTLINESTYYTLFVSN